MKKRCFWAEHSLEEQKYHDTEWGFEVHDDRLHFEMLILEGAQAGLSWSTVLKKREAYKKLFYNFDAQKMVKMNDEELETILKNPSIIRNRLKVFSVRKNAHVFLQIQKEYGSFDAYVWQFAPKNSTHTGWRSESDESQKLSKDLKKRGMTFVGSTIMYAYMQAVGIVNDHAPDCFLHPKNGGATLS